MASQREVLQRARGLSKAVTFGDLNEEELNDKGRVLLQLGRGDIGFDKLADDEIDLIGLDRSLLQRASRAVTGAVTGAAGKVGEMAGKAWPGAVEPPRRTGLPAQEFMAATKEAATAPGIVESVRGSMGGGPGPVDLFLRMLSGVERPIQAALSPLAGAGAVAEQAIEQVPRLGGQEPASTPVSRLTGLATELLPQFGPAARARRLYDAKRGVPSTGGYREARTGEVIESQQKALPPGPPELGTTGIPGGAILKPERATRRQLEGREQRALPPKPVGATEEVLADIGPARATRAIPALPEMEPLVLTGRVGLPKALPAERIPTIKERRLPGTVPLGETGEGGALEVGRQAPRPSQEPPGPPAPAVKPREPVGPREPASFVPPPEPTPPPIGVQPGQEVRREALGTMYSLLGGAEPGERIFIRNAKGTKVERVIGKSSSYPGWMVEMGVPKTRQGADRLMKAIDNVLAGKVDGPIEQKVTRYVEGAWPQYVERSKGGYLEDIPSPVVKDTSPGARVPPEGSQAVSRVRSGEVESLTPPKDTGLERWEWEKLGPDQRRAMIEFFRASDEELAGGFRGVLPPIPLPGPEEDERGSTVGWIKQAAQALGLAAPVLAMAFRRRSTRKHSGRSGGPAGEGLFREPAGPVAPSAGIDPVAKIAAQFPPGYRMIPKLAATRSSSAFQEALAKIQDGEAIIRRDFGHSPLEFWVYVKREQEAAAPKFERTQMGDQALVPGTPPREMPNGPVKPELPQKDITGTPLFGQERAAREAAAEKAQATLDFDATPRPVEKVPAPVLEGVPPPPGVSERVSQAVRSLGSVPEGHIRLYRAEGGSKGSSNLPEWIQRGLQESGAEAAAGRWFTDKPEILDWYLKDAGGGRLFYVDLPKETAEAYRLTALGQKHPAHRFSRDPQSEFFLAPQLATGRQPIATLGAQGKLLSATATGAAGAEAARRMMPEVDFDPIPLPPMEEEINMELDRLQQEKEGEKLPWGPHTPEGREGPPMMLAGLFPGGRVPRVPRAPAERAPRAPRGAPEVPEQYRRETIRPPAEEAPRAYEPPPGGGEPPGPPTRGGAVDPGPLPDLPDSSLGRAWRGMKSVFEDVSHAGRTYYSPVISRFEQMGPAGADLSRTIQNAESAKMRFYGQHVDPVVRELERLSPAEKTNFRQVAEEGAQPMSGRVRAAYDRYQGLMGEAGIIPREAQSRDLIVTTKAGEARPFQPRQAFFPHEYSPEYVREVIRPGSPKRQKAIDHLLNTGQATDAEQAAAMLDDYFGAKYTTIGGRLFILEPDRFVGGLERAREINLPGYITDPAAAVAIRGWKASRRFSELDHFGRLDANVGGPGGLMDPHTGSRAPAHGLIGRIQQEKGYKEAVKAFELFQQVLGHQPESEAMRRLAGMANSAEAFTKLPLAVIANASQTALTALRTDISTAARGLAASVGRGGYQAARELGTISEMAMRDFYDEVAGTSKPGRATRTVLIPYNAQEILNRAIGSNAGRVWADKLERRLASTGPRDQAWMRRELGRLNFEPEEIRRIVSERRFGGEDKARVAWSIVDQTQYLSKRARRSEFFNTPVGSVLGLFKTFAINTGRLMDKVVIEEARHGNWAPAARMAVLFPIVGEVVEDLRSLARGTERPDGLGARLLENFFAVGGFGVATDFVQNISRAGARGVLDFLAGPFISDVAKVGERVVQTAKALGGDDEVRLSRELQELGRFATKQVPYVGPGLSEALRTDPKAEARARQTWEQRLRLDPADRSMREVESISRQAKLAQREANRMASDGYVEDAQDMLRRFNERHGTNVRLTPGAVRSRRRREAAPEAQRRRDIAPGVRGKLGEIEIPALPE